jgi:hypothetical protein
VFSIHTYFSLDERFGGLRAGGGHRARDPDPRSRGVDPVRVRGVPEEPRGDAGGGGLGGGEEGLRRPALPGRPGEPQLQRLRGLLAPARPAPATCMIGTGCLLARDEVNFDEKTVVVQVKDFERELVYRA